MKKYASFIIVALFIGGLFLYRYYADSMDYYVFYDNENGYYDGVFNPFNTTAALAPTEDKLDQIKNLEDVKAVYPILGDALGINTRTYEGEWEDEVIEIKVELDGHETNLRLPLKVSVDKYESTYTAFKLNAKSYTQVEYVENNMLERDGVLIFDGNIVVRRFSGVDSGIYIDKSVYYSLGCTNETQSLKITLPLYIPSKMKTELVHHQTEVDQYGIPYEDEIYDFYAEGQIITEYQVVEYTFEVEAVIDDGQFMLYYPIELNNTFLEQVDDSKVVLEENEMYFKPNEYHIVFNKKLSLKSAKNKLGEVIDSFLIQHPFYYERYEKE